MSTHYCTGVSLRGVSRLLTSVLVVLVAPVIAAAIPATADAQQQSIEGLLEGASERGVTDDDGRLPEPTASRVNLEVRWQSWQRGIADGDPKFSDLETLRSNAVSLGIPSLPYHQLAVLYEARRADELGLRDGQAIELRRTAHDFAPHLPYAKLETAQARLSGDLSSSYRAIPTYINGLQQGYLWLDTRIEWGLKIALWLLMALGAVFLGFVLGQLLRYFGITAYDGTRVLPRGFSSTQTVILLVALVLVPGLLLQSPLMSLLLLLLLIVPFQQLNERLVSCLFFALLAALPFVDDRLGEFLIYPDSEAQQVAHAHYHGCDDECRDGLDAIADTDRGVARYVERVDRFRDGSHETMQQLSEWFDEYEPHRHDDSLAGHWLNLEGAVQIALGKHQEAIDTLDRAVELDTDSPAPWFNQGRAYQLKDQQSASHRAMQNAFGRDLDAVSRKADFSDRDPHSFLMIEPADATSIWSEHRPEADDAPSLLTPGWTIIAGDRLDLDMALWLGLGAIAVTLLTIPLVLGRRVSSPCPKCGLARDPTETAETGHHHYCRPCYETFVSGASLDYHARVHSEATLGRRDRLQRFLRRAFSLVTPGVGHILGGHALRGTIALGALATGIFILVYPMGPLAAWRGPFGLFETHWAGPSLIAWMCIAVAATFGLSGLINGIHPTRKNETPADDGATP